MTAMWKELVPSMTGGATNRAARITAAIRFHGAGGPRLILGLTRVLMEDLGWAAGDRLGVQEDETTGRLRFTRGTGNWHLAGKAKAKGKGSAVSMGWPKAERKVRNAEIMPHEIERDAAGKPVALVATLPDWAVPQRAGFLRAAEAQAEARRRAGLPAANGRRAA